MVLPQRFEQPTDPTGSDGVAPRRSRDLSALPAFLRRRPYAEAAPGEILAPDASAGPAITPVVVAPLEPGQLPMAGLSARRVLLAVAVVAMAWGIVSFGRQVTAASAASAHADELRADNGALQREVSGLQLELSLIEERRYIDQEARAYRLGGANEVPFALEASAPKLPSNAPGSALQRLGADTATRSPLDSWLQVLFGPGG